MVSKAETNASDSIESRSNATAALRNLPTKLQGQYDETKEKKRNNQLVPLLAGLSGGAVSTAALYPLDLIKVRLQVNENLRSGASTKNQSAPPMRLSSYRVFLSVLKHEGIGGLYQGLSPAIIGSAVSWGGYFFLYEGLKRHYAHWRYPTQHPDPRDGLSSSDNFSLACLSGALMVGLTNPIWLIKTRMQLQLKEASRQLQGVKKPYGDPVDAARTIVREEGFLALYKGVGAALLLTSHGGVQFVAYEFLRKRFHYAKAQRRDSHTKHKSVLERLQLSFGYLMIGATSKIIASTVTYPFQVVKSRLQQRSETLELTPSGGINVVQRDYSGIFKTLRRIWNKEGVTGFFKGCIPNAIRVAPGAAITFVVYEAVLDACDYR